MQSNDFRKRVNAFAGRGKQAGLTLTELMVSLAIAGLIIGGAVMFARSSGDQQASNQHAGETIGLRAAMRAVFNGQGNFGSPNATYVSQNATLITAGKVPATLSTSSPNITNSWSGAMSVMGNNAQFYLSTANVPLTVCVNLVSHAIQAGWNAVGAGGAYPGTKTSSTVVSPSDAASLFCTGTTNTIYFTGS